MDSYAVAGSAGPARRATALDLGATNRWHEAQRAGAVRRIATQDLGLSRRLVQAPGWRAAATRAAGLALALLTSGGAAQATLHARDGGMVYDDVFNITWLADLNYAKTSGYSSDGRLDWTRATQWAANLSYGGYSDWRLPTLNPTDTSCTDSGINGGGFNCSGGELSHLFVTSLGNLAVSAHDDDAPSPTAQQLANFALFSNVQSNLYWSGTPAAVSYDAYAWYFASASGDQYYDFKSRPAFAAAVRDGDVATAVPEPSTTAMAGLGLIWLAGVGWRRRAPCA